MKLLPDAVKAFIDGAHVCRIATVREGGTPHIIPVCPAFDGDRTMYVDVAKDGVTARALVSSDRITAIVDEYSDDWSKLKAVILRCRAEQLQGAELEKAWELFRAKYPQGQAIGWEARHTLALRVGGWTEWGLVHPLGYQPE
jgi:nitroimidazol reductase NimA-like FMN-containing flavoprotein (pyridoxamine 5'-phosphate oxidase superfamily)